MIKIYQQTRIGIQLNRFIFDTILFFQATIYYFQLESFKFWSILKWLIKLSTNVVYYFDVKFLKVFRVVTDTKCNKGMSNALLMNYSFRCNGVILLKLQHLLPLRMKHTLLRVVLYRFIDIVLVFNDLYAIQLETWSRKHFNHRMYFTFENLYFDNSLFCWNG